MDGFTNLGREGEKGDDFLPYPPPALPDRGVFLAPWPGLEGGQCFVRGARVNGAVDVLQFGRDRLAILIGDKLQRELL